MFGRVKSFTTILLILVFVFSINLMSLEASELEEIYKEQQKIDKKINETETIINQKERERKNTLAEIASLNQSMEKTNEEIERLEKKLAATQEHITETEKDIEVKEKEVAERTQVLEERLCQIYKQGDVSFLEVFFQSTSISDFLTRFEFLKMIAENDTALLAELEAEREQLEEIKAGLEKKKLELASLKEKNEQKKQQLQIASAHRQNLVKQIEQEKEAYEQMLKDLEEQSKKITAQLLAMQSSSGEGPGWFQWPTPGYYRITSPYGMRVHPITKVKSFHQGVDIAAPYGHDVVAGADGKVLSTSYQGAYGNTIIVDHGGGVAVLYPHLSKYLVKPGDIVRRNQVIGKVGTSGWSTGPHIHFEVRINGEHVNPMPYLRK